MKNKLILGIGIALLLAIGGVAGWYFLGQTKEVPAPLFDNMGRQLTENFLRENKFQATYKLTASGNNYGKYFKEDKPVTKANGFAEDLLPAGLRSFMLENCPQKVYTPSESGSFVTFDRYVYQLNSAKGAGDKYNFRYIEFLVDQPATEIVCYWIRDDKNGTFQRIDEVAK